MYKTFWLLTDQFKYLCIYKKQFFTTLLLIRKLRLDRIKRLPRSKGEGHRRDQGGERGTSLGL